MKTGENPSWRKKSYQVLAVLERSEVSLESIPDFWMTPNPAVEIATDSQNRLLLRRKLSGRFLIFLFHPLLIQTVECLQLVLGLLWLA